MEQPVSAAHGRDEKIMSSAVTRRGRRQLSDLTVGETCVVLDVSAVDVIDQSGAVAVSRWSNRFGYVEANSRSSDGRDTRPVSYLRRERVARESRRYEARTQIRKVWNVSRVGLNLPKTAKRHWVGPAHGG
jgi:hypothetical protein